MKRARLPILFTLALAALGTAPMARMARADEATPVVITGVVTDGRGRALPSLTVTLEASRTGFSLRRMSRSTRQIQRLSTVTNARGEYSLNWRRSSFYNAFALVAEVPLREAGRDSRRELVRVDITSRLRRAASPLVVALAVEDTKFLDALTAFLAGLRSADERRVYETLGRPDSVDTVHFADRVEAAWWYFAGGRVVRFRDGAVVEESAFDPVQPFARDR